MRPHVKDQDTVPETDLILLSRWALGMWMTGEAKRGDKPTTSDGLDS